MICVKLKLMMQQLLKKQEGIRKHVYKCTEGVDTIGVGRNISKIGEGLRDCEIEFMLENDIEHFYGKLQENYEWFSELNNARKVAIISMVFQMGLKGFSGFEKTIQYLSYHQYDEASTEMLISIWANKTPSRAFEMARIIKTGKME